VQVDTKEGAPARRGYCEGGAGRFAVVLAEDIVRGAAVDREGVYLDVMFPQGINLALDEGV
jgi:hypothetical protein